MQNITYRENKSYERKDKSHKWYGQGISVKYELTDGYNLSPHGHFTKANDLEKDWRDAGETNYTSTARTWSGSGQRETGVSGHSMVRPSTNHGTPWLYNEDEW